MVIVGMVLLAIKVKKGHLGCVRLPKQLKPALHESPDTRCGECGALIFVTLVKKGEPKPKICSWCVKNASKSA